MTDDKMREEFENWAYAIYGHNFKYEDPITYYRLEGAWLTCAARDAERIAALEKQAALCAQDNLRLLDALEMARSGVQWYIGDAAALATINEALSQPLDTSALDAYVAEKTAALQAKVDALIPTGWKVVPIILTDAMRDAGNEVVLNRSILYQAWDAILAVAPPPPIQGE